MIEPLARSGKYSYRKSDSEALPLEEDYGLDSKKLTRVKKGSDIKVFHYLHALLENGEEYISRVGKSIKNFYDVVSSKIRETVTDKFSENVLDYIGQQESEESNSAVSIPGQIRSEYRGVNENMHHIQTPRRDILKEFRARWREFFVGMPKKYSHNPYRRYALKLV